MNNEAILRQAIDQELPVTAHVRLLNGEHRIRVGPVANINHTHVTIFDMYKGYRTTPLKLVQGVRINRPERNWFAKLFTAVRDTWSDS